MSTATTPNQSADPRTIFAADPKGALDMALAESEKWREAYNTATEVRINRDGTIEVDTIGAIWKLATRYASSDLVPDAFRRKPDNCFVAAQLAFRMGVDVFMLMQNMYVVHGRPGLEAKFAIALCNQRGPFRDRIKYRLEGEGKSRKCTAYAHDKETGELMEQTVTWALAEAEGWTADKKNRQTGEVIVSKWKTMTDLMLSYRAAMFLIRLTCPEVLMGMALSDELEDLAPSTNGTAPRLPDAGSKADALVAQLRNRRSNGFPTEPTQTSSPDPETDSADQRDNESENDPPFNPPSAEEVAKHSETAQQQDGPSDQERDREEADISGQIEDCLSPSKLEEIKADIEGNPLINDQRDRYDRLIQQYEARKSALASSVAKRR